MCVMWVNKVTCYRTLLMVELVIVFAVGGEGEGGGGGDLKFSDTVWVGSENLIKS